MWVPESRKPGCNVLRVFLVKSIQHLSEKTQFPGFLIPVTSHKCLDMDSNSYPDLLSGSPPKFNYLFTDPLSIFPEKFVQTARKFLCKVANRQTDKQRRKHISAVLVRWGGKIKCTLIAHFLGNIFAKNCRNRTVYVKIIANQKWNVFWETVYFTHWHSKHEWRGDKEWHSVNCYDRFLNEIFFFIVFWKKTVRLRCSIQHTGDLKWSITVRITKNNAIKRDGVAWLPTQNPLISLSMKYTPPQLLMT